MAAPREFDPAPLGRVVTAWRTSLDRQVTGGGLAGGTRDTYIRDVNRFTAHIGAERILDEVEAEDIDDALVAYAHEPDHRFDPPKAQVKSAASVARYRNAIGRLFAYAETHGFVQRNPMPDTAVNPTPAPPAPERTALPLDAARALLDAPSGPTAQRDTLIVRLLVETGARVAELCAANIDDIAASSDSAGALTYWWHIRRGKGGKARVVPITTGTHDLLQAYLSDRPEPWHADTPETQADSAAALLVTVRGRRIRPRDIQHMCQRIGKRLPAEQRRAFTPHALRHTMATLALAHGADLSTVQRLLGHASLATTGLYLDEIREELARTVTTNPVTGEAVGSA